MNVLNGFIQLFSLIVKKPLSVMLADWMLTVKQYLNELVPAVALLIAIFVLLYWLGTWFYSINRPRKVYRMIWLWRLPLFGLLVAVFGITVWRGYYYLSVFWQTTPELQTPHSVAGTVHPLQIQILIWSIVVAALSCLIFWLISLIGSFGKIRYAVPGKYALVKLIRR